MADTIAAAVFEKLASLLQQQIVEGWTVLGGVDESVEKLNREFQAIRAVLDDVGMPECIPGNVLRYQLQKLREISYDMEDVLDEWSTGMQKLQMREAEVFPLNLVSDFLLRNALRYAVFSKIENINKELDDVALARDRSNFRMMNGQQGPERYISFPFIDVLEVHGRDREHCMIVNLLLSESSQVGNISTISIVGAEGLGKTTLVRSIFNDMVVKSQFEKQIWVCVTHLFSEIKIATAILESLIGVATILDEFNTILHHICHFVKGKNFLLVLDDVGFEDTKCWELLKEVLNYGSQGSRILVTTCNGNVANSLGTSNIITLGKLPREGCWSLFSQLAFFGRNNEECEILEDIGRKIVGKCKGFPFALKILGSFLCFKSRIADWKAVLDSQIWDLEEEELEVFKPLLLSYYDLHPTLRKSLSYCAIFPKGREIEKDRLIKLWMAQNYLLTDQSTDVESVGEKYFKSLSMRSFFQDFRKDHSDGRVIAFKMHNLVHEFAQRLSKSECFSIEVDSPQVSRLESYDKARHSMIILEKKGSFPISICNGRKLSSLMVECRGSFMIGSVLSKSLEELTCLRSLDLSKPPGCRENPVKELPGGIKRLIHLRYLNLSNNRKIKVLPEMLCDLFNLQTLDITSCSNLQKLPQGMGKLTNLRHLMNSGTHSLSYMPKGIERLTCLRTLKGFVVGSGGHGNKECSLKHLKNLIHLQGSFFLRGLGNVVDDSGAKRVELQNKSNLVRLDLKFNGRKNKCDKSVLEALQPPPGLQSLGIYDYKSKTVFPSWMMALTKLSILRLDRCIHCEHLPPLGKLSSLESLFIWNMSVVKGVGNEFLGIESEGTSSAVAFPKLKSLDFWMLEEWEQWDYEIARREEIDVSIMPCLRYLTIRSCNKLKDFPDHLFQTTTLKELRIYDCHKLQNRYRKETGDDWPQIPDVTVEDKFMPYLSQSNLRVSLYYS